MIKSRIAGGVILLLIALFVIGVSDLLFRPTITQMVLEGHSVIAAVGTVVSLSIPTAIMLSYVLEVPFAFALLLMLGDGKE